MVLILVLVVVAALSLGALAFSELMVNQREVVHVAERQVQAAALAESGLEAVKLLLAEQPDIRASDGSWYQSESRFCGVLVIDDDAPRGRGRFSIVAPAGELPEGIRFGLDCESGRLNLNTLLDDEPDAAEARRRLMSLPNMTEDIADAILDWLDEDDDARDFGAESPYYESLTPPYRPANRPLRRIEELLHVRGVTPELLFGADANLNGKIDPSEAGQFTTLLDERGWAAYLTLHSRELDRRADGQPKINVNQADLETLHAELEQALGAEWATFIVGYRQQDELYDESNQEDSSQANAEGDSQNNDDSPSAGGRQRPEGSEGSGNSQGEQGGDDQKDVEHEEHVTGELDLSKEAAQTLDSVLDLVGRSIKVEYVDRDKPVVVAPLFPEDRESMRSYLPALLDCLTTEETTNSPDGRINLHLAPEAVLASVPGIDADLAAQIVAQRPATTAGADQQNLAWLVTDGLITLDEAKGLLPRLTVGGSVYRVQAVGFFDEGGPIVRLEVILDATTTPARVLSLKNLSAFGRGFQPEVLGAVP
jgi:type II secretory pathway component PulK